MTHYELNTLLKKDIIPEYIGPFKTLIDAGFTHLTPKDFEAFVLEIFNALGFPGSLTPVTGDGGVDILAKTAAGLIVIQCKKYDDNGVISAQELRAFLGALVHFKAIHGYFVTTSSFTSHAKEFSSEHDNITLIDGECLKKLFLLPIISADYRFPTKAEKLYHEQAISTERGELFRIQAERLYQDYMRDVEKLRERFMRVDNEEKSRVH